MHFRSSLPLLSLLLLSLLSLVSAQPASTPAHINNNNNSLLASKRTVSSPLKARAPAPSRRMGKRAAAQAALGPTKKDYSAFLCPDKAVACPLTKPGEALAAVKEGELVTLKDWFKAGFECLDTKEELGSCGGCSSLGKGQDCTLIPNARNVGCNAGKCTVESCKEGFVIGRDGKSCMRRGLARR